MCGIFGFISSRPADIQKIKILGIYNATRGTDSCGIVINDKVTKGMKSEANWSDFCEKNSIHLQTRADDKNFIILGHTRNASNKLTKDDADCAHPIVIKTKKNSVKLIGVHNGTISNHKDLAKNYKVKDGKIDSITLMSVLSETLNNPKQFDVLKDYEGAATVMWYHPSEPNVLKIFKGASKSNTYAKELTEERPLYVYKEDEQSYYFSSIKESLYCIGGDINTVSTVPLNCVITIKPGEKFRLHPINRDQVDNSFSNVNYGHTGGYVSTFHQKPEEKPKSKQVENAKKLQTAFKNYHFSRLNQFPKLGNAQSNILLDNEPYLLDQAKFGAKVFFWKGRYTRNGHIIGRDKDNYVELELDIYGFDKTHSQCDMESLDKYYFYQGLLLLSKQHAEDLIAAYKANKDDIISNNGTFNCMNIAKYCHGFVANYNDTMGNARAEDGKNWATGKFSPMFDYNRQYRFGTGTFHGAEIIDFKIDDLLNTIKDFDKKAAVKMEEKKIITAPEQKPFSNKVLFENKNVDNDKLYNLINDASSSLKAIELEIGQLPKYVTLTRLITGARTTIMKKYNDIINNKETTDIVPFVADAPKKGLLYSE